MAFPPGQKLLKLLTVPTWTRVEGLHFLQNEALIVEALKEGVLFLFKYVAIEVICKTWTFKENILFLFEYYFGRNKLLWNIASLQPIMLIYTAWW